MNRVALFFGSFDPIHIGHVNTVREILNEGVVDEVWVIPSIQNPHKSNAPVDWTFRYTMCVNVFRPYGSKVRISPVEYNAHKSDRSTYTYDIIKDLKKNHPLYEFYFVVEYLELGGIHWWHRGAELVKENNLIITYRTIDYNPNESSDDKIALCKAHGNEVEELNPMTILETSSTKLRRDLYEGKEVYPLIPLQALKVIQDNNLYE